MTFHEDIESIREKIELSIRQYGYAPEHNIDHFLSTSESRQKPIFISWPDGTGLMTHKEKKEWYTFSEPVAPPNLRAKRVIEFTQFILDKPSIKKVVIESRVETRKEILDTLPPTLKALSINYTLNWPIMNMEKFNPQLPGSHFKSLRNAKNKFYRDYKVEIKEATDVPKKELHEVVEIWIKKRTHRDMPHSQIFHNMIDSKFIGCQSARAIMANGKSVGFNAGWPIPNSDQYYGAVGIFDYTIKDLGALLYLEDLEWIKNAGYKTADMGGVEKGGPLNFKNQFLPESWYKTFIFSIVKK